MAGVTDSSILCYYLIDYMSGLSPNKKDSTHYRGLVLMRLVVKSQPIAFKRIF